MLIGKNESDHIDWWRGFLSFIVFFVHLFQIVWFPIIGERGPLQDFFATIANTSVAFFFSLSGMLIAQSVLLSYANSVFDWKRYILNRVVRIYPTFIIMLVLSVILVLIFPILNNGSIYIYKLSNDKYIARDFFWANWKDFLKAFFMIHPGISKLNGALWSLFIEWWLYISVIFVVLCFSSNRLIKRLLFFLISLLVLFLAFYEYGSRAMIYIIIWYFGFVYSLYLWDKKILFNSLIILSSAILVLQLLLNGVDTFNINKSTFKFFGIQQILISILFLKVTYKHSGVFFFKSVAKYSYTLYIIHFPLLLFFYSISKKYFENNISTLAFLSLVLLVLIPVLSKIIARFSENKDYFKSIFYKTFT